MERGKALNSLVESAQLLQMLESLMATEDSVRALENFAAIRMTIETARERILHSHSTLLGETSPARRLAEQARAAQGAEHGSIAQTEPRIDASPKRRSLREAVEKSLT